MHAIGPDGEASAIAEWLAREGRFAADMGAMLQALSERLLAGGVPLARSTTHIRTLHPEFRGVTRVWWRGGGVEEDTPRHGVENTPSFLGSPLEHVIRSRDWLIRRLDAAAEAEVPMLAELRARGLTHYAMAPLVFSDGIVNAVSWATDAPEGFSARDIAILHAVAPAFELVAEPKALRRIGSELLATYVGRDPATRIMAGAVQRGDAERIRAAIMVTDLRDFTTLSDELPEARVLDLLNLYFDCVVPAVRTEGGDVLKFIGDGVLAVFRADGDPGSACGAAFRAARAALEALASARQVDPLSGDLPLHMGVALHFGEVAYGNVGSGSRLDFTTIGRDVNLVARLERLCAPLERELLTSEEFAAELDEPLFEIGHFDFKGFRRRRAVFGLVDAADEARGRPARSGA